MSEQFDMEGQLHARTVRHPRRKSPHLQTPEQQPLAMLDVHRREEPTHDHQRRQPVEAKEFAEDWYLQVRGKLRDGEL